MPFDIAGWSLSYLEAVCYTMPSVLQHIDNILHKGHHSACLVQMTPMAAHLMMEVHPLMRMAVILQVAEAASSLDQIVSLQALPAAAA